MSAPTIMTGSATLDRGETPLRSVCTARSTLPSLSRSRRRVGALLRSTALNRASPWQRRPMSLAMTVKVEGHDGRMWRCYFILYCAAAGDATSADAASRAPASSGEHSIPGIFPFANASVNPRNRGIACQTSRENLVREAVHQRVHTHCSNEDDDQHGAYMSAVREIVGLDDDVARPAPCWRA